MNNLSVIEKALILAKQKNDVKACQYLANLVANNYATKAPYSKKDKKSAEAYILGFRVLWT